LFPETDFCTFTVVPSIRHDAGMRWHTTGHKRGLDRTRDRRSYRGQRSHPSSGHQFAQLRSVLTE
jgi:hypothetical protein